METLKFTLKGKDAFFKMPEVNSYYYFTYGNIHKVALLGMFGAILGYKGYAQLTESDRFPEFYERLKKIHVAIIPKEESKGHFQKKIQYFNNSVGYASQEMGGNLIVKQQWLEEPEWEIYVQLDSDEAEKIAESILNHRAVYLPYLGSNDHPAILEKAERLEMQENKEEELERIHSLFPEKEVELDEADEMIPYKYTEYLPVGLRDELHTYQMEKMVFTNLPVLSHEIEVYMVNHKNIVFI